MRSTFSSTLSSLFPSRHNAPGTRQSHRYGFPGLASFPLTKTPRQDKTALGLTHRTASSPALPKPSRSSASTLLRTSTSVAASASSPNPKQQPALRVPFSTLCPHGAPAVILPAGVELGPTTTTYRIKSCQYSERDSASSQPDASDSLKAS